MAKFYKGAAPGTHWHRNDPLKGGFTAPISSSTGPEPQDIQDHILGNSHRSPCISVTYSYAVAWSYAITSQANNPTVDKNNPGYIYEIDIDDAVFDKNSIIDPMMYLARLIPYSGHYQHTGIPAMLLDVIEPGVSQYLQRPPMRSNLQKPPIGTQITDLLRVFMFVLRDAEILIFQRIPESNITARHQVY